MRFLLDTHALLWWLNDDPSLSSSAREVIAGGKHLVCISTATIWEIVIKRAVGKLEIPNDFREILATQSFRHLDITTEHAFAVDKLPQHHRDPFDRILIAQCMVEGLTFISRDPRVKEYDILMLDA